MAITFDDGPYHYTNELLDLLSQNGVVVTFFVTGMNGAKGPVNDPNTENPAMLRRMLAEGHQIASHSWSHENMESISVQEQQFQIAKLETALADLFGFFPTYYRPPYTGCGEGCIAALGARGYHVANYNLDTKDWQVDVWQARQNYDFGLANSSPQSSGIITLAHDIHQDTVRDLTQFMIDKASGAGYRLVTVGECLGDSVGNWYRNAVTGGAVEMAAIRAAALGKSGLQAKEKYHQAGVSSFPVAPTQPSRTSTKSTTKGKFNPTAGAAAKPDEDYLEDEVDFEYDDDVKGSRYRESSATIPTRSPGVLYAVVAIMVGVVAMF
ncbi:uncharacterized protein DNG_02556 [Cephalotrichum gorgonifer]|uniref:NodB homology domain-containing protein n=1 Tax=Cephalotrichum gorgonifer TaxID=2041049 RepID=A0AAE8MV23_9PEZI|nr:uncharacterized protein DNG_02556 [Cephalotrichum gorgonifer]